MDIILNTTGYHKYSATGVNPGASRAVMGKSKADSACKEMESLFIQKMFKEMRASIPKSGLTHGGKAEEMFTDMLDAEMAKALSASGGIGLSSLMQRHLEVVPEIGKTGPDA